MKRGIERVLRDALRLAPCLSDGQLLESFLARRDEAAFEALVRRHGPMVLGVCRRVLGNFHDAEDAFQATILVLLRKASGIRPRERVGNWLYGVAFRTALEAKTMNARRRAKEKQAGRPEAQPSAAVPELSPVIDQEINRLPEKYRLPIILCDLEGRSRKEVAAQLGWKEGTLSGRLSRARALLAKRLVRRGITLSATGLAAALAQAPAAAYLPITLARSTTKTVLLIAAGQVSPTATVAALVRGVLRAMLLTRLKIVTAFLMVLIVAGLVAHGLPHGTQAAEKDAPAPADFAGKFVVVFGKTPATLEKVQVHKLGDRAFIVGQGVKNPLYTKQGFEGIKVWIPLQDVTHLLEFSDHKQVSSK